MTDEKLNANTIYNDTSIYMYEGKSLQLSCSCISVSTSENVDIASTFVSSFCGNARFANESWIIFLTRLLVRIWCCNSGRKFGDWYTTQKDTPLCAPRFAHLELSYEMENIHQASK